MILLPRLVLFTRFPVAGKAKTRLIPKTGEQGAADIHRRLTEKTVTTLRQSGFSLEIAYTGANEFDFADWLGNDIRYVLQAEGDLTAKLLAMLDPAPVIFFGADTPDLLYHHVKQAVDALSEHDVVIGPAEDGGYYLIGVKQQFDFLFTDMPWSSDAVLPETLKRLAAHGIKPFMLETLSDCDRPEDLARWPELAECYA
jgi:uncharacterized protein